MYKVILINPYRTSEYFNSSVNYMPLELITLASYLKKDYTVKIIDLNLFDNTKTAEKEIRKELDDSVLCVGITVITSVISSALRISRFIKQHSKAPVVWGGVHPTCAPKETLENENIDFIIFGEGEITFPLLLKALSKKTPFENILGLGYKKYGRAIINKRRQRINFNKTKLPAYEMLGLDKYKSPTNERWATLQLSRGCPHSCSFCFHSYYDGGRYGMLNPKKILKQIEYLYKNLKIRNVYLADDCLFVNTKKTISIFKKIAEKNYGLRWWRANMRIDAALQLTDSDLKLLEKVGVSYLILGAESGSQRILDLLNKKITPAQILELNQKLKRYNISPHYNFMIGIPSESREEMKQTINLSLRLIEENPHAVIRAIYIFGIDPGTKIYKGLKTIFPEPKTLEEWASYKGVLTSQGLSKKGLEEMRNIYFYSIGLQKPDRNKLSLSYLAKIAYYKLAVLRLKHSFFGLRVDHFLKKKLYPDTGIIDG